MAEYLTGGLCGAARAVQAAVEIRAAVRGMGVGIWAWVHTGEVAVVPGGVRGVAVHQTARIMALGNAGDILVSSTTREGCQPAQVSPMKIAGFIT